jgi:predicted RNA binding protein YcfA (HicA-like mRNA interferase family)
MKVRKLRRMLEHDGWTVTRSSGSHHVFQHPVKRGIVIVAVHGGDVPSGMLRSILKQAGLEELK